MPNQGDGYAFQVTITLTNTTNTELIVSIPRGTIIEPQSTHLTFQSAVIAKDYIFRLNPKERRSVMLEAECWNQHLAPPHGVPGKLTPLKGNIQKTTNVWGTSSSAVSNAISVKPSQNGHVFAAFANTSPEMAHEFLREAANLADRDGVYALDTMMELDHIAQLPANKRIDELCSIAEKPEMTGYVKAASIRSYLIRQGSPTENHISSVEKLLTNIYALTSHRLASRLYDVAMELADLSEDRKIAVTDERRKEITQLIRQKYTSILDSLHLLDEIEWETT